MRLRALPAVRCAQSGECLRRRALGGGGGLPTKDQQRAAGLDNHPALIQGAFSIHRPGEIVLRNMCAGSRTRDCAVRGVLTIVLLKLTIE